jgi:hypothetical protein
LDKGRGADATANNHANESADDPTDKLANEYPNEPAADEPAADEPTDATDSADSIAHSSANPQTRGMASTPGRWCTSK